MSVGVTKRKTALTAQDPKRTKEPDLKPKTKTTFAEVGVFIIESQRTQTNLPSADRKKKRTRTYEKILISFNQTTSEKRNFLPAHNHTSALKTYLPAEKENKNLEKISFNQTTSEKKKEGRKEPLANIKQKQIPQPRKTLVISNQTTR